MNTSIFTIKFIFSFRGEDSVKNAISKISKILSSINEDNINITDKKTMLSLSDLKLGINYYKKEFMLYDKADNFKKSLHSMEEELTGTFTEISLKNLEALELKLRKTIPKTSVFMDIYPIPTNLEGSAEGFTLAAETPIIPPVSPALRDEPKVKRGAAPAGRVRAAKKVISVSTVALEEDNIILKGTPQPPREGPDQEIGKLAKDLSTKELNPLKEDLPNSIIQDLVEGPKKGGTSKITKTSMKSNSSDGSLAEPPKIRKTREKSYISKISKLALGLRKGIIKSFSGLGLSHFYKNVPARSRAPGPEPNFNSLTSNTLTDFIRGIFSRPSKYFPSFPGEPGGANTIDNLIRYLSNLSKYVSKLFSRMVVSLLFISYIIIYVSLFINVIITGLNINIPGVPYLLDYLQSMNIYLDLSIFDNMINILKNIKTDTPIPDILAEIIKEAESLVGNKIPQVVKESILNTIITISENASSTLRDDALVASDVSNSSKELVKENVGNIEKPEPLIKDENENKTGIFMTIFYTVIYGIVGIVALDVVSRIPSDPEFYSSFGDFTSGLISLGVLSITSLLQMIFGNSDNSSGSNSNTTDRYNKWKADDEIKQTIEYKKELLLRDNPSLREGSLSGPGIKYISDKASGGGFISEEDKSESIAKTIESRTKDIIGIGSSSGAGQRGESSNNNSNNSNNYRANAILGIGNSLPSLPNMPNMPSLPNMSNLSSISNPINGVSAMGGNIFNAVSNTGGNILRDISNTGTSIITGVSNTGGAILNGVSNTGGVILNGVSNTGEVLLNGVSNTGGVVLNGVSNTGTAVINGASNSGEALVNGLSKTGGAIVNGVSSTGNNIANGFSNMLTPDVPTSHSKIPIPSRLRSPWGALFTDPSTAQLTERIKEDDNNNNNSMLSSAKKFFKRRGDETFTEIEPNTGPLPTNLRESMIPKISLNNSSQHIELEPYIEESDTENKTEVIYIINNVTPTYQDTHLVGAAHGGTAGGAERSPAEISQLGKTITDDSHYDYLVPADEQYTSAEAPERGANQASGSNINVQKSNIHKYGEEIRILSEGINDRNLIIERTEDILLFQEKEIKTHLMVGQQLESTIDGQYNEIENHVKLERQLECTIIGQQNKIEEKEFEINIQNKTIQSQIEIMNEHRTIIDKQREAVNKSLAAINTLTNSIDYSKGNSLLTKDDVKILVESITDTPLVNNTDIPHVVITDTDAPVEGSTWPRGLGASLSFERGADVDIRQTFRPYYNVISSRAIYTDSENIDSRPSNHNLEPSAEQGRVRTRQSIFPSVQDAYMRRAKYGLLLETSLNSDYLTGLSTIENENPTRSSSLQNEVNNPPRSSSLKVNNTSLPPLEGADEHPTRSSSLQKEPLSGSSTSQDEPLTRSTTLPQERKEFWSPQPDNSLIKGKGKVKWKYGL